MKTAVLFFLNTLMATLLALMMLLMAADVVCRYFFNSPITGTYEIVGITLACIVFLGLPLCSIRDEHIKVSLFDDVMSRAFLDVRNFAVDAICALSFMMLAWRLWRLAEDFARYGEGTTILQIPLSLVCYFEAVMIGVAGLIHVLLMVNRAERREA
jgi:TRAP-type transport system small permease protein